MAALGRVEGRHFPSLVELTGERGERTATNAAQKMVHNVRLLKAALQHRRQKQ